MLEINWREMLQKIKVAPNYNVNIHAPNEIILGIWILLYMICVPFINWIWKILKARNIKYICPRIILAKYNSETMDVKQRLRILILLNVYHTSLNLKAE